MIMIAYNNKKIITLTQSGSRYFDFDFIKILNTDTNEYITINRILNEPKYDNNITKKYATEELGLIENSTVEEIEKYTQEHPTNRMKYIELNNVIIFNSRSYIRLIQLLQTTNKKILVNTIIKGSKYLNIKKSLLYDTSHDLHILNPLNNLQQIYNIYHNPIKPSMFDQSTTVKDLVQMAIRDILSIILYSITKELQQNLTITDKTIRMKSFEIIAKEGANFKNELYYNPSQIEIIFRKTEELFKTKAMARSLPTSYRYSGNLLLTFIVPYLGVNNIRSIVEAINNIYTTIFVNIQNYRTYSIFGWNQVKGLENALYNPEIAERFDRSAFKNADYITEIILEYLKLG